VVAEFELDSINKYNITIEHLDPWELPGDYIKIIIKSNNHIIDLENLEGWVKFDNNYTVPEQVKNQNLINTDYFIYTKLDDNKPIILLFGWVYASEPGLMTIIDLTNKNPKLIFNNFFQIKKIFDIDNDGVKEIIGSTDFKNNAIIDFKNNNISFTITP
jgi:hypothetical protein